MNVFHLTQQLFLFHQKNSQQDASAELYQELRRVHHTEEAVEAAMLERARQAPTPCPTCREVVPRTAETLSAALALCSSSSGDDELESRAARAELSVSAGKLYGHWEDVHVLTLFFCP